MPKSKIKDTSYQQMICRLGAKRSAIRKKAAKLLAEINKAEQLDEEESVVADQIISPNIHHYFKPAIAYKVMENAMGLMLGGGAAIEMYASVAPSNKSVISVGLVWCIGALLGGWVNREIMKYTGMSFTKNICDLKALHARHDELAQEIKTVKLQRQKKS